MGDKENMEDIDGQGDGKKGGQGGGVGVKRVGRGSRLASQKEYHMRWLR